MYLLFLEKTLRPVAIKRQLGYIGQMHFEKLRKRPDRDPLVKRTLESVQERAEAAKIKDKAPALFEADDFLDASTPKKKPAVRKSKKSTEKQKGLRTEPPLVRRKKI